MKSKLFARVLCIALAVVMVGSMTLIAFQMFSAEAAATPKANGSGYITDSYVNLRSGAGTNYSIVTTMAKNTKVTFTDGKLYNIQVIRSSGNDSLDREALRVISKMPRWSVGKIDNTKVNVRCVLPIAFRL